MSQINSNEATFASKKPSAVVDDQIDMLRVAAFKKSLSNHFAHLINRDFSKIDADGNGEVSLPELLAAAPSLGMNQSDARILFRDLDADGSGAISTAEVKALLGLSVDGSSANPLLDSSSFSAQNTDFVALDVREPRTAVSWTR